MSDSTKIFRNLAYIAVASCSLVMAGCGGSSSSSSDDEDPIVTPQPTPEPTPVEDPQPETLVYSGSTEDADLSEADLDDVAAEIIKASYAKTLIESSEDYMESLYGLMMVLAGEDMGPRSAAELDLTLEPVGSGTSSGTTSLASECGGTIDVVYEETFEEFAASDEEVGYGEEHRNTRVASGTLSDDFCIYGEDDSDIVEVAGAADFDGESSSYSDSGSGGYYYRNEDSSDVSADITLSAAGFAGRYQAEINQSYYSYNDNRDGYTNGNGNSSSANERLTINGQVVEVTSSYTYDYAYDGESGSSVTERQEIVGFDGSVFLIGDDNDFYEYEEGVYAFELEASYDGLGTIFAVGEDLTLCEDGSGFGGGSIIFGVEDPEAEITFSGCGDNATVTVEAAEEPPVSAEL